MNNHNPPKSLTCSRCCSSCSASAAAHRLRIQRRLPRPRLRPARDRRQEAHMGAHQRELFDGLDRGPDDRVAGGQRCHQEGQAERRHPQAPAPRSHLPLRWHLGRNPGDREIKAWNTKVLEIEFENDIDPVATNYFLEADFRQRLLGGLSRSTPTSCPVRGSHALDFDNEKVKWNLTNDGNSTVYLQDLRLGWPADQQRARGSEVRHGHTMYETPTPAPSLNVEAQFEGNLDDRRDRSAQDRTAGAQVRL